MPDSRLRTLERQSASGDIEAHRALIQAKARLGEWCEPIHLDGGMTRPITAEVEDEDEVKRGACGIIKVTWEGSEQGHSRCVLIATDQKDLVTCGACKRTRVYRGLAPVVKGKVHLSDGITIALASCGMDWLPMERLTLVVDEVTCKRCLR